MPKGVPDFQDLGTDTADVLIADGWNHTGVSSAGFWTITQLSKGSSSVDIFTPTGQAQDRVWLKPSKGGQKAVTAATNTLEAASIVPAERRGDGVRLVRLKRRARAKANPIHDAKPNPGPTLKAAAKSVPPALKNGGPMKNKRKARRNQPNELATLIDNDEYYVNEYIPGLVLELLEQNADAGLTFEEYDAAFFADDFELRQMMEGIVDEYAYEYASNLPDDMKTDYIYRELTRGYATKDAAAELAARYQNEIAMLLDSSSYLAESTHPDMPRVPPYGQELDIPERPFWWFDHPEQQGELTDEVIRRAIAQLSARVNPGAHSKALKNPHRRKRARRNNPLGYLAAGAAGYYARDVQGDPEPSAGEIFRGAYAQGFINPDDIERDDPETMAIIREALDIRQQNLELDGARENFTDLEHQALRETLSNISDVNKETARYYAGVPDDRLRELSEQFAKEAANERVHHARSMSNFDQAQKTAQRKLRAAEKRLGQANERYFEADRARRNPMHAKPNAPRDGKWHRSKLGTSPSYELSEGEGRGISRVVPYAPRKYNVARGLAASYEKEEGRKIPKGTKWLAYTLVAPTRRASFGEVISTISAHKTLKAAKAAGAKALGVKAKRNAPKKRTPFKIQVRKSSRAKVEKIALPKGAQAKKINGKVVHRSVSYAGGKPRLLKSYTVSTPAGLAIGTFNTKAAAERRAKA